MMKLLYEMYFAFISNKLLHFERYYMVTYDVSKGVYCIWTVDGFRNITLFAICRSKMILSFTWEILMGRSEALCH